MDGKALAARIRAEVAEEAKAFGSLGLATVLVGDDPASEIYIRRKHEAAREAGITAHDHHLPAETTEDELLALIAELNADDSVDGILVQLPLPDQIDEARVLRAVDAGQGRRRLSPGERRPALPRRADVRAGDAARDHGAARGVRRRRSRAPGRS